MEYRFNCADKVLRCLFGKTIDSSNCTETSRSVDEAIRANFPSGPGNDGGIIFDLSQTEYVTSVFMRVVLITAKKFAPANFSIVGANQFVRELFRVSGLDMLLGGTGKDIESGMREERVFPPPPSFTAAARWRDTEEYGRIHAESLARPEEFWAAQAKNLLVWDQPFTKTLDWNCPAARWFDGGKLNASVNCLDAHLGTPVADKPALIWEGEPVSENSAGEVRKLSYAELHREVCRAANAMLRNGVRRGDRVLVYMPMVPEAVVAMLACARIGAVHSVVFGGFGAAAIAERVRDSGARLIITADGGYRKGAVVPLKNNVDEALDLRDESGAQIAGGVERVIVLRRVGGDVHMRPGRDVWWHQELAQVEAECPPASMDSEDLLFILYTSGSTGKPKGIMHSTAGYLLNCKLTFQMVFDIKDEDIYWCTADIGWITGHSYVVYGPLANGATIFIYEGAPNHPGPDRFWELINRHRISIFYTAPTAIRSFMRWGDEWPAKHGLSSLRLLGTVGEPINPQAWTWFHEMIGRGRCPIVDTWWQTETGAIMISTLPGAMPAKPGSAGRPLPGVNPEVVDDQGNPVDGGGGKLVIRQPWPSMLRGVWGDPERFLWTYWKEFPGVYFTGDSARRDGDGYHWIMGRVDDVINVAGHRIGTAEVESALVSHPSVAEAAVVGRADDVKGSSIIAFVTLIDGNPPTKELAAELRRHVNEEMGALARPEEIRFTESMPKTRSGKIMRRVLKQVAAGVEVSGDLTTLEDFGSLKHLGGQED